jgi:hypothetical protein
MDIGEEDGDIATSGKVLSDLDGRDEVTAVRSTSGGSTCNVVSIGYLDLININRFTPVDLGIATLIKDGLDDLRVQNLREILLDEAKPLLC